MKRLLSFLLSVVFLHAQVPAAFAKSGGPDLGGGGGTVDTIGTYAGVLIPLDETLDSDVSGSGRNSIGLFSLGVPDIGMAQGAFVVFVDGNAYNGTITGVADPLDGELQAILDAVSNFTISNPADPTGPGFSVFATGNLEAEIRETANFSAFTSSAAVFSFATIRLEGEAVVDISGAIDPVTNEAIVSNSVTFVVDGFKQSSTVSILTDIGVGNGGGNGGGDGATTP